MKTYIFTITIQGEGETPEDAWWNAAEKFGEDPGAPPDEWATQDEWEYGDE